MFTVVETLHEGNGTFLLRAVRDADRLPVVIKALDPRRRRPRDLDRLKNEHDIGRALELAETVRPIGLITYEGMPALVMEDFGGESLDRCLVTPLDPGRFVPLAVRIAHAVAEIHKQNVLHKDLKPENILLNPESGEVKIADFGIATRLYREQTTAQPLRLIEGSLPYMSPEQTGRMNRTIDHRSDLYSLGVTFYELLTGRLPFQATDPLEWVHCHIARMPVLPAEVEPAVPEVLSAIVMKLLAKAADERYQNAAGLEHDLQRCLTALQSTGRIEPFALGERDVSERFQIPQKFYGRDTEIALLLAAFERVVATSTAALVLISGYSGAGKSSLVHELYRPIVQKRGFFISGKFDQYKRDIPYATIAQAFRELVLEILAESEERLGELRQRLQVALGINGQLVIDLIPQVELVIGKQPPVAELPLTEAQNRFHMVFRQFVGVFAHDKHPLVLFLDDLQWVDSATLKLLTHLVTHPDMQHMLTIGAYRDNEVNPSHPLMVAVGELRASGAAVQDIVLTPLSAQHLGELVMDTVHCSLDDAEPLARLLYDKTAGNPFFAIQFLTTLHHDGLIELDARAAAWRWDVGRIEAKGFTDNVLHLMVGKVKRLPAATQQALTLAACIGNTAPVHTLSAVLHRSEVDTHGALWGALREGLLVRVEGGYRFVHDRIQEAAYSLIPDAERPALHLRIGRLLLADASPEELRERIFEIVNQLNLGSSLISSEDEMRRLIELNLSAGLKAKASTAYHSAARYLAAGMTQLGKESWTDRYELTYRLHFERAECEYLTGQFDDAAGLFQVLLHHAKTNLEKANIHRAEVDLFASKQELDKAVECGIEGLHALGIQIPARPTYEEVTEALDAIWNSLGDRQIESLVDLPTMTDPTMRAALGILAVLYPPALMTDLNLVCLCQCKMVDIALRYGNSDATALGYAYFGLFLGPVFGRSQDGYRFGKLGYDLVEKHGLLAYRAKLNLVFGSCTNYWSRHLRNSLDYLNVAFQTAVETGDLTFGCYCCNHIIADLLILGEPLHHVYRESERRLDFTRKARFDASSQSIVGIQRFVQAMRGLTVRLSSFSDGEFDDTMYETFMDSYPWGITTCWYYILKLELLFLAEDFCGAIAAGRKAQPLLSTSIGHVQVFEYWYYYALALLARYPDAQPEEQTEIIETAETHRAKLAEWSDNCPENFAHKHALVAAELSAIQGDDVTAMHLYEQAIHSARENGFVQDEGVALEVAARFYRARGFAAFADTYLRDARTCFVRWGAGGKVHQIDRLYPRLLEKSPLAATATFAVRPEQLDLLAVVKASQTISSEIVQARLIPTLLEIVLEQGGAQRACLLLARSGAVSIEAEAMLDAQGMHASRLQSLPLISTRLVPPSIVDYVRRTKQPLILADAGASAGRFSSDEYIVRTRPKSVLCLPILRQAEVFGLLYLENNLVPGAFTPDRLAALELLASQAAVSLENALLLAKEQAARQVAEAAERRAAFLAEASELLGESLEYQEVLRRLAELCVRHLADFCVIDIIEEGELRRPVAVHGNPAKQPLLTELQRYYTPRRDSARPVAQVIRTGQPLLFSSVTDEVLRSRCVDERHVRLLHEIGIRTAIYVPLVARGQITGALTLASANQDRLYGPVDLELAQEFANRAAIAIDNARLYRDAQDAIRQRDEFLAVASHELRSPMTSLGLALQAVLRADSSRKPRDPEAWQHLIGRALRQSERLNRLIEDLLDVSRIETQKLPLEPTAVELDGLVQEVVARLELDLMRSQCPVAIRSGALVRGFWDRSRIDQVVTNLLTNAIKFGAGKPIDIVVGEEAGIARLRVQDQGIGIDPAKQRDIFERFGRAVSAWQYGGLGLGLYICRKIVEAHGGSIRVESRPGAGAAFTVELPCAGSTAPGDGDPHAPG
jgi:predicted ATPase/signal transduction histidine kinase/tRNA A-37 threonylcarbamoyl transferase component Bud32